MNRHECPMTTTPVGKPSVTKLLTPTPRGKFSVDTGHGTGYAQTSAKTSYSGGGGGGGKSITSVPGKHGTEYGQVSSRG